MKHYKYMSPEELNQLRGCHNGGGLLTHLNGGGIPAAFYEGGYARQNRSFGGFMKNLASTAMDVGQHFVPIPGATAIRAGIKGITGLKEGGRASGKGSAFAPEQKRQLKMMLDTMLDTPEQKETAIRYIMGEIPSLKGGGHLPEFDERQHHFLGKLVNWGKKAAKAAIKGAGKAAKYVGKAADFVGQHGDTIKNVAGKAGEFASAIPSTRVQAFANKAQGAINQGIDKAQGYAGKVGNIAHTVRDTTKTLRGKQTSRQKQAARENQEAFSELPFSGEDDSQSFAAGGIGKLRHGYPSIYAYGGR